MRAIWRKFGRALVPASDEAYEMLHLMGDRSECLGEFKFPRNLRQLRLWWALMGILVDHGLFEIDEAASDATKIATGHATMVIMPDTGKVNMKPKSIAFQSMKQADFNKFMKAAINVICARWLPDWNDEALEREVFAIVDGPSAIGQRVIRR